MLPVKVGVVGLGRFGRLHALTLARLAEAELVALVARRQASLDALASELPGVPGWTDLDEAIRASAAEAWVVACATAAHVPVAKSLLKAGKIVLLEKPIADNLEEARSLAPLVRPDSGNLMLGHIVLFNSEFQQLLAEARQRSRLSYIDCVRHRPTSIGSAFPGENPLHAVMVHDLYAVQVLVERAEPTHFSAQFHRTRDGQVDLALATLRWAHGPIASFAASYLTPAGMPPRGFDRTEVFGEGWSARINPNPRPIEVWDERASWPMALEIRTDSAGATGMMAEELRCFCRVVRGQQPVPVGATYADAMQVQQWMDKLAASAASREETFFAGTEDIYAAINVGARGVSGWLPSVAKRSTQEPKGDEPAFSVERIRADVKYLSSDQLEGRGLGGRGEELATDHIAKEFRKAGVDGPAGERGTYFQKVSLVRVTTDPKATLSAAKDGRVIDFRCEEEFAGQTRTQQPVEDFDAEAVFLGHGIVAPEFDWNDYKGADVKGKVVVVFTNEPPSDDPKFFRGKALTYYGRWSYKYEEAARQGAKAVLIIHTNETAGYPYSVVRRLEGVQPPKAADVPALAFAGWLSRAAGEKLLGLVGKSVDEALKEARTKGFKAVPLGVRVKGHIPSTIQKIVTKNVIGIVPGSDPTLKSEAVIFTAHWDHLGLGKAALGDNIYNGAADNATGCGILLEMARMWAAQKPRPKRSAIFLATTAEESGLLGAYHYADSPAVPLGKTALNLNFDMVLPLGIPESVIVSGAERTTAWPMVQNVARKHKLEIEPDSYPEQGFFYRSDHFALARGGVPAFSVSPGSRIQGKPADYAKKAFLAFNKERYHTPQDEFREDWDFSGFPIIIRFAYDIAREAANQEQLPTWTADDEFLPARQKSGVK